MEKVNKILEKYNHFIGEQIYSIVSTAEGVRVVTMVIQDEDGEETNRVILTFSNIKEARILQNHVLSFMDMASGITIIKDRGSYGFAIGHGSAMLHVHNAPLYIIASDIEVEEQ